MFDIKGFFMSLLNMFKKYSIAQAVEIEKAISPEMDDCIELWSLMSAGRAPWCKDGVHSCGIESQIASKLAVMASREIALKTKSKTIESVMHRLDKNTSEIVEYMTLRGGCLLRPMFSNAKLQYELIPLGSYIPLSYDMDGTLTAAIISKEIADGNKHFLLTEKHVFKNGSHSVESTLYNNDNGSLFKTTLSACSKTADISPFYVWENVKFPMIVEFRNRAINKIDGSAIPVSVLSGAEKLIEDADKQYSRMIWEQEANEAIIFADRDMFARRTMRNGETTETKLTPKLKRLIVQIDGDCSSQNNRITEFAPQLRTEAQNAMFQQILRRIELSCALGKGTLSDMESQIQTATQYSGGRQELFAIVDKMEDELEDKYKQSAQVFAYIGAAFKLGENDADIEISWNDDQTRKDLTQAKTLSMQEITAGVKNKWEYRRDFFGEDEQTAKENTPEERAAESAFSFGS